jgi:hypothetical protein
MQLNTQQLKFQSERKARRKRREMRDLTIIITIIISIIICSITMKVTSAQVVTQELPISVKTVSQKEVPVVEEVFVQKPVVKEVSTDKPVVEEVPVEEPVVKVEELMDENIGYVNYMVENFSVPRERAKLLVESVEKTGTEIPVSLVLAMMQKETDFRNIPAANQSIEDSMGYVQMQSATREWLRNVYPELPYISSQQEFRELPETQVLYMVKYLEYATEKFNGDFTWVVSSYNMGVNNSRINDYYVGKVKENKHNIEQHASKVVVYGG